MRASRPLAIGGAIVAFGLAVAWLLPPTTPIGGVKIGQSAQRPVRDDPPRPPVTFPADPGESFGAGTNLASAEAPRVVPSETASGEKERPGAIVDPAADADADADAGAPDPDFQAGYRWAARREVQDRGECRLLEGTPREDGCLAYADAVRDRADADRDDPRR